MVQRAAGCNKGIPALASRPAVGYYLIGPPGLMEGGLVLTAWLPGTGP
jgi:hypothetical protein